MGAHDLAVHAAGAGEIHGLEMQQAALALAHGGDGHSAHVPQELVGVKLATHPHRAAARYDELPWERKHSPTNR